MKNALNKLGVAKSNPAKTPMTLDHTRKDASIFGEITLYRHAIGCLMYAAITTKVDIIYAVIRLSLELTNPSNKDWTAVKRTSLRYLCCREHFCIAYDSEISNKLELYCDDNFAGGENYKSTTSCVGLPA